MARSWYLNFRCANKANEINSLPKAIIASGGAKPGKNPGPLPPPLQQRPGGPSLSASRPWPAPSLAFVRHVVAVRRRPPWKCPGREAEAWLPREKLQVLIQGGAPDGARPRLTRSVTSFPTTVESGRRLRTGLPMYPLHPDRGGEVSPSYCPDNLRGKHGLF